MLPYLQEEDDLGSEGGVKLRKSILTGCNSPPCMAAVRSLALICDSVLWPLLRAVKPTAETHALDVLPIVWPKAIEFFRDAREQSARIIMGRQRLDLDTFNSTQAGPSTQLAAHVSFYYVAPTKRRSILFMRD